LPPEHPSDDFEAGLKEILGMRLEETYRKGRSLSA